MKVESLYSQIQFDFEGMKHQIESYKVALSSQYTEIKDITHKLEQNIKETRNFNFSERTKTNSVLGFITEYINI